MDNKCIHIICGGTVYWVRSHLALSAPAYGKTAIQLQTLCEAEMPTMDTVLHLTKMASGTGTLETNEDVRKLVQNIVNDNQTKVVFFPVAMCDWELWFPENGNAPVNYPNGKNSPRLPTTTWDCKLVPAPKVINEIRKFRKDIFLVGFKHSCNLSADDQYRAGLKLCKDASCNLVLANDTGTGLNMVITPEEARYHQTTDRNEALKGLVEMTKLRSHLTFTRSTVIAGDPVPWDSPDVPQALRTVVDYCIKKNAYKPFNGATVGHFACKLNDTTFLTSRRKTNFNQLQEIGLVKIVTDGPDSVLAYGSKPSVGGQSQRIVFRDHPGMDCILHFHCPLKAGSKVPVRSQYAYECGSMQCGENTSQGLMQFGNLKAVYLDEHGPNIVFPSSINPQEVIDFVEANFELSQKTGGYVSPQK